MATLRQKVFLLADELGATVEVERENGHFTVRVDAPTDSHWIEGVHQLVEHQFEGFGTKELWSNVHERMQDGIENCNHECEW